jgi:hypothetical protein
VRALRCRHNAHTVGGSRFALRNAVSKLRALSQRFELTIVVHHAVHRARQVELWLSGWWPGHVHAMSLSRPVVRSVTAMESRGCAACIVWPYRRRKEGTQKYASPGQRPHAIQPLRSHGAVHNGRRANVDAHAADQGTANWPRRRLAVQRHETCQLRHKHPRRRCWTPRAPVSARSRLCLIHDVRLHDAARAPLACRRSA